MWNNAAPISEKDARGAQLCRADKRKERCRPAKILRGGNSFGRTAAFHGFCAPAFVRRARPVSESASPRFRVGVSPVLELASPRFEAAFPFIPTAFPCNGAAVFPLARGPFVWAALFPLSGGVFCFTSPPLSLRGSEQGKAHRQGKVRKNGSRLKIKTRARESDKGGKREGRGKTKNKDLRTKGRRRRRKKKRQKGERKKAVQGRGKEKAREKRGRGEIEGAPKAG